MNRPSTFIKLSRCLSLCLCLGLILNACVPAAFVAGATVGGAVVYDQRSITTIKHDMTIANELRDVITGMPQEEQKNIHVIITVFNGHVLLAGQVPHETVSMQLASAAKDMKHVRRVFNKITVGKPTSFRQHSKDTWITARIRTDLLSKSGFKSTQISVMTEDNVVYLMGKVSRDQAAMATGVAQKISGVKQVVKLFEYIK
jgi:osmotically-inducible protein OsmY